MIKTIQTEILVRALGKKGVEDLMDQYNAARKRSGRHTPPTASHIRLARLGKTLGVSEAARKVQIDQGKIHAAITRVARWNYLNNTKHLHV